MTASRMPAASPQWTSIPGSEPTRFTSPMEAVDGLLAEAGSRSGPSTMKFMMAMAM